MQEHPTAGVEIREDAHAAAHEASEPSREVARLEELLLARAHERRGLADELGRRTVLLRDAAARFSELSAVAAVTAPFPVELPVAELGRLRAACEAAVGRAIEAEAARADAAFRLDEALGHLRAEQTRVGRVDEAAHAELSGSVRGLRARLAEIQEAHGVTDARLLLCEHDLADARTRAAQSERELSEAVDRFELESLRARSAVETHRTRTHRANAALVSMKGERDGIAARADETELAFREAQTRARRTEHSLHEALEKLGSLRAEIAELAVVAQSRGTRIAELGRELGAEQAEARALRAEISQREATHESLQSALAMRDDAVESLTGRLRLLEAAHERLELDLVEARAAVAGRGAQDDRRARNLRTALSEVRAPLSELTSALHGMVVGGTEASVVQETSELSEEPTLPGIPSEARLVADLEDRVRASQQRVEELEAQLGGRMSGRDAGVAALKGELIDMRASSARLADDLARERARRRRLSVTVHALRAARETGEDIAPWLEELLIVLNEGASNPPPAQR